MTEHSPPYLCPACGYDINPPEGSSVLTCPECGHIFSRFDGFTWPPMRTADFARLVATFSLPPLALWPVALFASVWVYDLRYDAHEHVTQVFAGLCLVYLGAMAATQLRRLPGRESTDRERVKVFLVVLLLGCLLEIGVLTWLVWEFGYGWRQMNF